MVPRARAGGPGPAISNSHHGSVDQWQKLVMCQLVALFFLNKVSFVSQLDHQPMLIPSS